MGFLDFAVILAAVFTGNLVFAVFVWGWRHTKDMPTDGPVPKLKYMAAVCLPLLFAGLIIANLN